MMRELTAEEGLDPAGIAREIPADLQLDATDASSMTGPDITSERVDFRPISLEDFTSGLVSRGTLTAAGGAAGFAAGGGAALLTGPGFPASAPFTAAAGSALGTMAGSAAYDNIESFLRAVGVLAGPAATPGQIGREALEQGAVDFGISAAVPYVTPIVWAQKAAGKIFGVTGLDAVNLRKTAEQFGIELSAVDVGNAIAKGYAKIIGVFPWVGSPLIKSFERKHDQAQEAVYGKAA